MREEVEAWDDDNGDMEVDSGLPRLAICCGGAGIMGRATGTPLVMPPLPACCLSDGMDTESIDVDDVMLELLGLDGASPMVDDVSGKVWAETMLMVELAWEIWFPVPPRHGDIW